MMQCEIIRDLLPLYHDSACSAQSRAAVEAHVGGCNACAAQLRELDAPLALGMHVPDAGITRMKQAKNRLMRRTALTAVPLLIILGIAAAFLAAEFERVRPLPYGKVSMSAAWDAEDGTIQLTMEKPTRFATAQCDFLRIEVDGEWKDVAVLRLKQTWTRQIFDYSKDGPVSKSFGCGTNLVLVDGWGLLEPPFFDPAYESEFWNPNWEYPGDLAAVYYLDYPDEGSFTYMGGNYGKMPPEGWVLVWEK